MNSTKILAVSSKENSIFFTTNAMVSTIRSLKFSHLIQLVFPVILTHLFQGWGCAYRAFQTISSWILLNTSNPTFKVPSISEIQAALVQMKDKPTNFVGSKDWIGSIEISLCLEHFCNISCKIIHLPPDFDWAS
eukprot:Sdes_comp18113_c0_seq2m7559